MSGDECEIITEAAVNLLALKKTKTSGGHIRIQGPVQDETTHPPMESRNSSPSAKLGNIDLAKPSMSQANSVMKNMDGSYQIKAFREVLIRGLLPHLQGSHRHGDSAPIYPERTLIWIWTCKKSEDQKSTMITDKKGKSPFLITNPNNTRIEETEISSQKVDQMVSYKQWVAKIPMKSIADIEGKIKLRYQVLSTSDNNDGRKEDGRGWILNIALVSEDSNAILDHAKLNAQVYAELRERRVWVKEPEEGAPPARAKKTVWERLGPSGSGTATSDPSQPHSTTTMDRSSTPPAIAAIDYSTKGKKRKKVSEEYQDPDHNLHLVMFYRIFSQLSQKNQQKIMLYTAEISK